MTYPDAEFGTWVNETFVPVKLNLKEARAEAQKYGVVWSPWLVLLDENGAQIAWTVGPLSASDYRAWLERVKLDYISFQDTVKMLAVTPDNADMNLLIGKHYFAAGDWKKAIEHLNVAVKGTGPEKADLCAEACAWLGRAAARTGDEAALRSAIDCLGKHGKGGEEVIALERIHAKLFAGSFEEAAKEYDGFLKEHATSACAPEAWYWFGVARYQTTKKADDLINAWQKLIAAAPDNEWAMRASMVISK